MESQLDKTSVKFVLEQVYIWLSKIIFRVFFQAIITQMDMTRGSKSTTDANSYNECPHTNVGTSSVSRLDIKTVTFRDNHICLTGYRNNFPVTEYFYLKNV